MDGAECTESLQDLIRGRKLLSATCRVWSFFFPTSLPKQGAGPFVANAISGFGIAVISVGAPRRSVYRLIGAEGLRRWGHARGVAARPRPICAADASVRGTARGSVKRPTGGNTSASARSDLQAARLRRGAAPQRVRAAAHAPGAREAGPSAYAETRPPAGYAWKAAASCSEAARVRRTVNAISVSDGILVLK